MVRSHTQELLADRRPRIACDRCHAQKLRCLKAKASSASASQGDGRSNDNDNDNDNNDDDSCLRCLKLGTRCVVSPRSTRPRASAPRRRCGRPAAAAGGGGGGGGGEDEGGDGGDGGDGGVGGEMKINNSCIEDTPTPKHIEQQRLLQSSRNTTEPITSAPPPPPPPPPPRAGWATDHPHPPASSSQQHQQRQAPSPPTADLIGLSPSTVDLFGFPGLDDALSSSSLPLVDSSWQQQQQQQHNHHQLLSTSFPQTPPQLQPQLQPPPSLHSTNTARADAARDLAHLNVKLVDHYASLPPPLNPSSSPNNPPTHANRQLALDQTFTLTRSLISIANPLYGTGGGGDGCPTTSDHGPDHGPDQATVLLFLSCYYRLMDIYESLFVAMRTCAQNPHHPTPEDQVIAIPSLQIGSYVPAQLPAIQTGPAPPISAFSMHMIMVLILAAQLCEQLRNVIATTIGRRAGGGGGGGGGAGNNDGGDENVDHLVRQSTEVDRLDRSSLHSSVELLGRDSSSSSTSSSDGSLNDAACQAMWRRSNEIAEQICRTKTVLIHCSAESL